MFVRSEMKTPFRDGNTDTSNYYHPKVTPPKSYEYFTTQIKQDLRNSVISITKYMQLYFIKFHYVIEFIKSFTSLCLLP